MIKIFISSIIDGYEQRRSAVKQVIENLRDDLNLDLKIICFDQESTPSLNSSSQQACLEGVNDCDIYLGIYPKNNYGWDKSPVGISPTHEEYLEAKEKNKIILVFVENLKKGDVENPKQKDFLKNVGDYIDGSFWNKFKSIQELKYKVYRSLLREMNLDYKIFLTNYAKKLLNTYALIGDDFGDNYSINLEDILQPILQAKCETKEKSEKNKENESEEKTGAQASDSRIKTLCDAITEYERIIILGEPGSGKSTLLKWLRLKLAKDILIGSPKINFVPIYVELKWYRNSLIKQISTSLRENDIICDDEKVERWLKKGNFILLLDGLDEVQDFSTFLADLKDIITFSKKNKFILTSRDVGEFTQLTNFEFREFIINNLTDLDIKLFIEKYTDLKNAQSLFNVLQQKNLLNEARNPLILWFMIMEYKDGKLSTNKANLFKNILETRFLSGWESKTNFDGSNRGYYLSLKINILSEIAYTMIDAANDVKIDEEKAELIIDTYLKDGRTGYKELREKLLEQLVKSHVIGRKEYQLSFWHKSFRDYFAALKLIEQHVNSKKDLKNYISLKWENSLLFFVGLQENSTASVGSILETNLYFASSCLLESKNVDENLISKILSKLASNCESSIHEIRQRGIYFLTKIDEKYSCELLFEILNKSPYTDIKQVALVHVAKSKTERAKNIVCGLIDWNEKMTIFDQTSTQGSVAIALSNFGEEEHLKIIDIWKKNTDIFTCSACKESFIDIIKRNQLTEKVKEKLFEFYLEPFDQSLYCDNEKRDIIKMICNEKRIDLAEVIIEIGNIEFVPKLIQNLKLVNDEEKENSFIWGSKKILASYESNDVIKQLISHALDKNQSSTLRGYCIGALSKSKGKVDISIFENLVADDNLHIRRNAISGLRRYPPLQIKEILFNHINDDDVWIQKEIIEILGEKGLLFELVENNLLSIKYYIIAETYLEQIKNHHIDKLLPTLNKLRYIVKDNKRLQMQIAETYCYFSQNEKAKTIIEDFSEEETFITENQVLYDIIHIAPSFDLPYSMELIKKILKSIASLENEKKSVYEYHCIESIEKIGGNDSIELLKEIIQKYKFEKDGLIIERAFRSLNHLVSTKDEDWYISFLNSNTYLSDSDLHRVIEGLGGIGTEKSIKIIQKIAQSYKNNSYILNVCFRSYENIMFSSGKIINVQEEEIFLSNLPKVM